ncbi:MAG TPA: sugar isomerase domain-containing protein [Terriglobales bacterium]
MVRKPKSVNRKGKTPRGGSAALRFYAAAVRAIQDVKQAQLKPIIAAAELCAEKIARGGLVFLFGSGHSRMMVDEMTPRQGCFVGFVPLVETAVANYSAIVGANGLRTTLYLENYEGYAGEILRSFKFGVDDAFIIISTSGIRPLVVEMARGAKARKLPVIAIVSRRHCTSVPSGHSSGQKLIDIADLVIDNQSPVGDCAVELDGLASHTGPLSTVTGAMIINMIRCETASRLIERGHKPVMFPSHQFIHDQQMEDQAEQFYEAYRRSLAHLYE